MKKRNFFSLLWPLPLATLVSLPGYAQLVTSDSFTGATSSFNWVPSDGACLTAGTQGTTRTPLAGGNSSIPACVGLNYYSRILLGGPGLPAYPPQNSILVGGYNGTLPDAVGQGALRLTNGDSGGTDNTDFQYPGDKMYDNSRNGDGQRGAIISNATFPNNKGIKLTYSTTTYGGDNYGGTGADGMVFMLIDGTRPLDATALNKFRLGSVGGTLGYACSDASEGLDGAYLGIGTDEFGNFSISPRYRKGPSVPGAIGTKFLPGAIVLRGAGSISFDALSRNYPAYYPAALSAADRFDAWRDTCLFGKLANYSGAKVIDRNGATINDKSLTTENVNDYDLLAPPYVVPRVPGSSVSPIANQQFSPMPKRKDAVRITYALNITPDNLLDFSYSINQGVFLPVLTKKSITAQNGPLPPSFRFGFVAASGGGSNIHEISCFSTEESPTTNTSSSTNGKQSDMVRVGSQVYLSYYHPSNSWGQLTASGLVVDPAGRVTINSQANWDANCALTGGKCEATGVATTAQAPASRSILSHDGSQGVPFRFNSLSRNQQRAIGEASRVDFLRGDRSNEDTPFISKLYRWREGVLGDIVNSSPTWVGAPALPYAIAGTDHLTNGTVSEFGALYLSYITSNKTRPHVVYSGANDGMLHGFRAGAFDTSGAFSTGSTPNDGKELIAYVPAAVVSSIHSSTPALDFSGQQYAHNSYVDATPGTGDLYYNGAWHTWLVGGLGAGGNPGGVVNDSTSTSNGVFYALDISRPADFDEGNAAKLVIDERNSSNIVCKGSNKCGDSLGSVQGAPIIRLLHDGNWAVIFGNGRNSATGTAGVFIMSVDRKTGSRTYRFLDTGAASTTNKNGIDYVASGDLDGDHVTDYLYAGDAAGNVWRFDLTSSNPTNWLSGKSLLFSTPAGQPISTRLLVSSILPPSGGKQRLLISFGTGRQTPQTLTSAALNASAPQSLYGIWDWDMDAWNLKSTVKYLARTGQQKITTADLQMQTLANAVGGNSAIATARTVTSTPVCWNDLPLGITACKTQPNNKMGWQLPLEASGEQIIYSPVLAYGAMFINTYVPGMVTGSLINCSPTPASGFTMALSVETGGAPAKSFFATDSTSAGFNSNNGVIAGLGLNATGSPSIVTAVVNGVSTPYLVQQNQSLKGVVTKVDLQSDASLQSSSNSTPKRISWRQLR